MKKIVFLLICYTLVLVVPTWSATYTPTGPESPKCPSGYSPTTYTKLENGHPVPNGPVCIKGSGIYAVCAEGLNKDVGVDRDNCKKGPADKEGRKVGCPTPALTLVLDGDGQNDVCVDGKAKLKETCTAGSLYKKDGSTYVCGTTTVADKVCPADTSTTSGGQCRFTLMPTNYNCPNGAEKRVDDGNYVTCLSKKSQCPVGYTFKDKKCVQDSPPLPSLCETGYVDDQNGSCTIKVKPVEKSVTCPTDPAGFTVGFFGNYQASCSKVVDKSNSCKTGVLVGDQCISEAGNPIWQ